jgi:hypothetical protein
LLALGEHAEAMTLAREALQWATAANVRTNAVFSLQRLALGAALQGRLEEAARLFGFVEAQFASLDMASDYAEDLLRQRTRDALEAGLEPELLQRLIAEGAEIPDRDATALALEITA